MSKLPTKQVVNGNTARPKRGLGSGEALASRWRAMRRWLFFTAVDVQSCLLFALYYVTYTKPASPISTVNVPPKIINHSIEPTKFVRRRLYRFSGLIKKKDWERIIPLQVKHKLLADHFSEIFAHPSPQVPNQGQSKLIRYKSLFETLSTRGFSVPTWRNRTTDPFYLSIGPDGEFLFMTGKHRLALSKAAGLKAIPARISARHWQWQAYRDDLYQKGLNGELSVAQLDAIDHPDLQDIICAVKRVRARHKPVTESQRRDS